MAAEDKQEPSAFMLITPIQARCFPTTHSVRHIYGNVGLERDDKDKWLFWHHFCYCEQELVFNLRLQEDGSMLIRNTAAYTSSVNDHEFAPMVLVYAHVWMPELADLLKEDGIDISDFLTERAYP